MDRRKFLKVAGGGAVAVAAVVVVGLPKTTEQPQTVVIQEDHVGWKSSGFSISEDASAKLVAESMDRQKEMMRGYTMVSMSIMKSQTAFAYEYGSVWRPLQNAYKIV